MNKKNAVYFQSGGPTSVINSSFYGVIKEVYKHKNKISKLFISKYGVKGLIKNDLLEINKPLKEYKDLLRKNGAACGSARLLLKENDQNFLSIIETINKNNIGYVFVNGGNDSMDTANKLIKYFKNNNIDCKVVGIPKSVDNDLCITDHVPGYPSTCKYIYEVTKGVYQDVNSYDEPRINIIEVLCRDSGWLVAATGLASLCDMGPDLIYLPEVSFDTKQFLKDVKKLYEEKGNIIIGVAESLKDKQGKFVAPVIEKDVFGHEYFGSIGEYLCNLIKEKYGYRTRRLSLGIIERDMALLNSKVDTKEAIMCGSNAVKYALNGIEGMVVMKRISNNPYKIKFEICDFDKVANDVKFFPTKWINKTKNNITKEYIEYAKPFVDLEETKVRKDIL